MPDDPGKITPIHFFPKFCSQCGGALSRKFVEEEKQDRLCCPGCGFIAYVNPQIVAGALPEDGDGKILLLRRGIEPMKSSWTFPAGFVELGETVEAGALRETREETGVEIRVRDLLGVYSYPDASVVTVVYLADEAGGQVTLTREAEEIARFSPENIPWNELAFRSTRDALNDWAALRRKCGPSRDVSRS